MNKMNMLLIGFLLNIILIILSILSKKKEGKDMKRISKNRPDNLKKVVAVLVAMTIGFTVVPGLVPKVHSDGGAFVGGMIAGHIIGGAVRRSRIRTAAAVEAANQPRTVVVQQPASTAPSQPAPAQAAPMTAEQRLKQLDKLAAGGYITPAEYKAKKKAILDGM